MGRKAIKSQNNTISTNLSTHISDTDNFIPQSEMIITDPKAVPIIYHDIKQQMLVELIKEDKTIRQLSQEMEINPGTIKRHLTDLLTYNLVILSKIIPNEYGIIQKFYRAVANKFIIKLEFP